MEDVKFVNFRLYCPMCTHYNDKAEDEPCNECLECGAREQTEKPLHYDDKYGRKDNDRRG